MKNEILYDEINGIDDKAFILKTLNRIEQKLEKEVTTKQSIIEWQQAEMKRLQLEVAEKNNEISDLNSKLSDCHSHVEGNRQLINKLISDIDRLHQDIEWYKRTYEIRSLAGIIKDKLKHFFSR